jgi:SAM-dependent methyltransferase
MKELANLAWFTLRGRAPYAQGYHVYKNRLLRRVLADAAVLDGMRRGSPLPERYGVGVDERCVEYPWAIAHLSHGGGTLLDAGSVLNHDFVIGHPAVSTHELHILTFAPERDCFWRRRVSYLYGDLRRNPVRDAYYDAVVCLSTLEHVGCDNSIYSDLAAHRDGAADDYRSVMRELARVTRPGGTLLLSVPVGRRAHHGWLQIFDERMLEDALAAFGPTRERDVTRFRYTAEGWTRADAASCADATYAQALRAPGGKGSRRIEPDGAVAARAVACVRLVKACA